MKFSEYLASFITPQMTLLEKFNAMCKFLETHDLGLYFHEIKFSDNSKLTFVSTKEEPFTMEDLNSGDFFDNLLSPKFNDCVVLYVNRYTFNVLYYYYGTGITSSSLQNKVISLYRISQYEN